MKRDNARLIYNREKRETSVIKKTSIFLKIWMNFSIPRIRVFIPTLFLTMQTPHIYHPKTSVKVGTPSFTYFIIISATSRHIYRGLIGTSSISQVIFSASIGLYKD